ncbi:ATP-binding protein [Limnobacter humi]|uniref:histidine kinase n=1 Tax=Limnobacter humi TaxID=1778671 RepID=A0ABT1WIN3_9BURK|nr:ATP-binding protein [Limnobacter humi]MCQ8897372.1 ATP-binding protein [Limnobacter humi]
MAASPTSTGKPSSIEQSRARIFRALLIVIVCAVGPVALAAVYMSADTPRASSWQFIMLVTTLLGIISALFMGRKLLSTLFDALGQVVQSERQLRKLMELSGDWYWQQDPQHAITRIIYRGRDQAGSELTEDLPFRGLARWDVEGLKCIDPRYNWDSFRALLDDHQPFDRVLFEYWPANRPRLIFESTGRPSFSSEGHFHGYMGVSADLTQKKLNEQMLSLQRSLLQGVLLSAPVPELAAAYAKGLKNCLTAHTEVLLGYRDNVQVPKWHIRGTTPELHLPLDKGLAFWNNPEAYCMPLEGHDQQGLVWLGQMKPEHYFDPAWTTRVGVSCIWVAIRKAVEPNQPEYWVMVAQRGTSKVFHDDVLRVLTAVRVLGLCVERRVFEDDLQTLNATLEQRIEARTAELKRSNSELEAFTYTVSHDLRAPLRAIDGFSSILREDFKDHLPDDAQHLLDRISNNARQMGGLIDGLLDFSRLLRTDVAWVEVNQQQLIEQIIDQLDARRRATLDVAALPTVHADPVLLKQVWMNLIDNALKFSSRTDAPRVTIACEKLPRFYRFSVQDNGAGFDMKYADKLFNVFERLHHKKDFDGTGVGLAIVKRIIERHGGEIRALGEVGQGARFEFTLPDNAGNPDRKD